MKNEGRVPIMKALPQRAYALHMNPRDNSTSSLVSSSFPARPGIPCLLLLAFFLPFCQAPAATIVVTSLDDGGTGSLRAGLADAADGDNVDATGLSGTILLTNGELFISKSIAVLGRTQRGTSNLKEHTERQHGGLRRHDLSGELRQRSEGGDWKQHSQGGHVRRHDRFRLRAR